jgi:hypothetical protein
MLLGRVIRNSEFEDLSQKELSLASYLERVSRILAYVNEAVDEIMRDKEGSEKGIETQKKYDFIEGIVRIFVCLIYATQSADAVTSNSLVAVFEKIFSNKETPVGVRFLAVWCLLNVKGVRALKMARAALERKDMPPWGLRLLAEKLISIQMLRFYRPEDESQLDNLIADYCVALGADKRAKQGFINHLKKSARRPTKGD